MTKTELRDRVKSQLKIFLNTHNKEQVDQSIMIHLKPLIESSRYVGSFKALSSEPNLDSLQSQNFVFPKTQGRHLEYYKSNQFEKSAFGNLEPSGSELEAIMISEMDCILVPGIAFDKQGSRLGRGAGFFDQTLEKYQGTKVGLGYSVQVVDHVPVEAHDIKMNYIVTEKGVLKCQ